METSLKLADYYFSMLKSLSDETKLYLIKKLTDSMLEKKDSKAKVESEEKAKDEGLAKLAGIWANDPDMENIEDIIYSSRQSNVTRQIVSFDE